MDFDIGADEFCVVSEHAFWAYVPGNTAPQVLEGYRWIGDRCGKPELCRAVKTRMRGTRVRRPHARNQAGRPDLRPGKREL